MIPEADLPLDQALRALRREMHDDVAFARRVAARVSATPPSSRSELDADLMPPFPDDYDESSDEATLLAAPRGYTPHQAPMSTPMSAEHDGDHSERPSTKLAGLAGLTRSAPPSAALGVGEDSGLIDLKGMMSEPEQPDLLSTSPEIPSARKVPLPPVPPPPRTPSVLEPPAPAPAVPATVVRPPAEALPSFDSPFAPPIPPSSPAPASRPVPPTIPTAAAPIPSPPAAPAFAAPPSIGAKPSPSLDTSDDFRPRRSGRSKVWLWSAVAVVGAVGIGAAAMLTMQKPTPAPVVAQSEAPAATTSSEAPAEERVAKHEGAAEPAAPAVHASAAAPQPIGAASQPTAAGFEDKAAKPGASPKAAAAGRGVAAAPTTKEDPKSKVAAKGGAAAPPAAPAPAPEPPKRAGGSLDDVLGIGKDQPAAAPKAKEAAPTSNLPDRPDPAEVRSCISSKVSAANACVKGLGGPSSVTVSFSPAGNVSGVSVTSGPAKGSAEGCIKAAFSSCKVPASKNGGTGYAKLIP